MLPGGFTSCFVLVSDLVNEKDQVGVTLCQLEYQDSRISFKSDRPFSGAGNGLPSSLEDWQATYRGSQLKSVEIDMGRSCWRDTKL